MRISLVASGFVCVTTLAGCALLGQSESADQTPEVYGDVLAEYWDDFSPALKVSACEMAEYGPEIAAGALIQGLRADLAVTISEGDQEAWLNAAEDFIDTKCGSSGTSAPTPGEANSNANDVSGARIELWVEFWDESDFSTDGEECEVRLASSRKRAFVAGQDVTLLDGDGRVIGSSELRPSFRRPSLVDPVQRAELDLFLDDAFADPCVVRAIFEGVVPAAEYEVEFTGSELMRGSKYSAEEVSGQDNRIVSIVP